MNLPEAVPGLRWAAEHDAEAELAAAAEALAHYGIWEAIPVLKTAMAREPAEHYRRPVIEAVLAQVRHF